MNRDNKDRYGLHGYIPVHNCRDTRGGRVSLYMRQTLEHISRDDLSFMNNNIESIFIELDKNQFKKNRNIAVGVICRPPNTNITEFNNYVLDLLEKLNQKRKQHIFWATLISTF